MTPLRAHDVQLRENPTRLLTIPEAACELRCSRAHLYNILRGKVCGLPPLPLFHLGRKTLIRENQLHSWIRMLEDREREDQYATGRFGYREDELEFIAGA